VIGKHLQWVLNHAVNEVRSRRHEYLTLEHVLYSIASEPYGRKILENCGGSAAVLRENLEHFFATHLEQVGDGDAQEVVQTLSVQRVLQSAIQHIRSAGRGKVEIGDVLAAILEEEDSYACYYLRRQGITRLEVLTCISHAMEDASGGTGTREAGEDGGRSEEALDKYAVDLTERARAGQIDPLVGREAELERCIEVLCRRRKNNPLLVGDPGVGKTAVAEGLALRIAEGRAPPAFTNVRIFSLDIGAMLAGARYRGDFEGRMKAVVHAIRQIPNAIMFIDEIHTIVGAGATSGSSMDASNLLKPVLASGEVRCIGSTTHEEFRNHLEKDRALSRRFQRIDIHEPSPEECLAILKGIKGAYEDHHKVLYSPAVLRAIVDLCARHVQDRLLPDKAIDVLDEAGAAVRLRRAREGAAVAVRDVERIVARMGGIPERSVSAREKDRLRDLEQDMRAVIFGQDEAVGITVNAIVRARAGLGRENRPAGSFLFYGPTGVGKTEFARQLAELLGIAFLRYDMSEYMEKHSVSRLIGAPPGYVGFDQGGLLTEALRKTPYALVLLDEIEKAHQDIFNVLLQVMDYATLTDNTGRKADFRNVVLVMTSNAGVREMSAASLGFAEARPDDITRRGLKAVEQTFSPEFRNRLDALVPFRGLSQELMGRIVDKFLLQMTRGLKDKKLRVSLTSAARDWLAVEGYDPTLGARPLQRVMRTEIEDVLAREVLFGRLARGGGVVVDVRDGKLDFVYEAG